MSVAKLSEQLVKAGCEVAVFTTTANGSTELPVKPNITTDIDGVDVTYFKRITKDHTHLCNSHPRVVEPGICFIGFDCIN
jgi:hypothetical protein